MMAADVPLQVYGGVDTHKDVHVAAVTDHAGRVLGTASFPVTPDGYAGLLDWLNGHGELARAGVSKLAFTGSAATARKVLAAAAETLTPVLAECGGKDALLVAADQKRIKLIGLQMQAKTLRELRSFDARVQAADAAVEAQVEIIRQDLGLPATGQKLY